MTNETLPEGKPHKTFAEARIIKWADGYCLFVRLPNEKAIRTSALIRADFTTMQFETHNTIYTVERLLTS